ncbi:MAG: sigma-70 family RNA polymerase sigma factor [Lachnospiraceae bacterium]|nr:sigma-70 family RNA polymerase sigma factor [Lachnospiraceae bacterium]
MKNTINVKELSDEEVVRLYQNGHREFEEHIFKRFDKIVTACCSPLFLVGADKDDLKQEGRVGLYQALRDYEDGHGTKFATFAHTCISRQLLKAIEANNRKKHQPLNDSVSIESKEEDGTLDSLFFEQNSSNPEDMYLQTESYRKIISDVYAKLSGMEKEVFDLALRGYDYKQIAAKLGKDPKAITNALQRIRTKGKGIFQ